MTGLPKGFWTGYRRTKAAANMILRSFAPHLVINIAIKSILGSQYL